MWKVTITYENHERQLSYGHRIDTEQDDAVSVLRAVDKAVVSLQRDIFDVKCDIENAKPTWSSEPEGLSWFCFDIETMCTLQMKKQIHRTPHGPPAKCKVCGKEKPRVEMVFGEETR